VLRYTLLSDLPHVAGILFIIGLSMTPLIVIRNCQISLLVVEHQYLRIFLVTVCQPTVYLIVILTLSWSGRLTLTAVVFSYVASVASSYISEIASYRLNQLILLPLIGGAALGNYAVATNVALAPAPLGHAVGAVGFKDMAAGTKDSGRASLEDSFRAAVWLAALSTLFVSLIAPFVIPLAFGREFATAVPATIVLAIGGFFVICNYVLTSGLVAFLGLHRRNDRTFCIKYSLRSYGCCIRLTDWVPRDCYRGIVLSEGRNSVVAAEDPALSVGILLNLSQMTRRGTAHRARCSED
jgi:hypothetical protein